MFFAASNTVGLGPCGLLSGSYRSAAGTALFQRADW
jgi:hypothetical protein